MAQGNGCIHTRRDSHAPHQPSTAIAAVIPTSIHAIKAVRLNLPRSCHMRTLYCMNDARKHFLSCYQNLSRLLQATAMSGFKTIALEVVSNTCPHYVHSSLLGYSRSSTLRISRHARRRMQSITRRLGAQPRCHPISLPGKRRYSGVHHIG